jgi:hypothetical protein
VVENPRSTGQKGHFVLVERFFIQSVGNNNDMRWNNDSASLEPQVQLEEQGMQHPNGDVD